MDCGRWEERMRRAVVGRVHQVVIVTGGRATRTKEAVVQRVNES